jgi:hypothetical protein
MSYGRIGLCEHRFTGQKSPVQHMYLNLRRAEERAQSGMIVQLGLVRAVVSFDRPGGILESKTGRERGKKEAGMLYFKLFERQLHVFIVIIIIEIVAPIMHRKEIHETDIVV